MTHRNKLSKIMLAMMLTAGSAVYADQDILEVESFSGIEVGTGIATEVICGTVDKVTLESDADTLKHIEVSIENGILEISRRNSTSKIFNNIFGNGKDNQSQLTVEIITTSQLSKISASTGSTLKVDECAVNTSHIDVEAGTGAVLNIEGSTASLNLEMSTGSLFNRRSSNFKVDNVTADLSTGAGANLCGATTVSGNASMGATLRVGENTNISDYDTSFGAEVQSSGCK